MSETLWNNWGDGEHAVAGAEQPAGEVAAPASSTLPAAAEKPAQIADPKGAPGDDAQAAGAAEGAEPGSVPPEVDQAHAREAMQQLQAEFGPAYAETMTAVKGLIERSPQKVQDYFAYARYPDGRAVANDPEVIAWLARMVPSGGSRQASQGGARSNSTDAEIRAIEAKIGTKEYLKNESMQARLRELYAAHGR